MLQSCDSVVPQHLYLCALDWYSSWELIQNANMVTIWQLRVWLTCRVVTPWVHNCPSWCALDWCFPGHWYGMPMWWQYGKSMFGYSTVAELWLWCCTTSLLDVLWIDTPHGHWYRMPTWKHDGNWTFALRSRYLKVAELQLSYSITFVLDVTRIDAPYCQEDWMPTWWQYGNSKFA